MTWPPRSLFGGVSAVVLVTAALGGASAASLGGIDAGGIGAWVVDVDIVVEPPGPPGPVACSGFDDEGSIIGQPAGCAGGTWNTSGGNWHVVNGTLKANATTSIAWVPGPSPYLTVEVDVIGTDKKHRQGGAVVSYDPVTGSYIAAILVGPNTVELRTVSGGSTTVLGSYTTTLPGDARLRLSRDATKVTVTLGGVPVLWAPIGAGSFPGTAAGLYHDGGPAVDFDNFLVTSP